MRFESRRSPVLSTRGMVATSHPLAAQAGLAILRAGGNAADAAVATAAALNVVEPTSTGIGGDCFALFYDSAARAVAAVNGSGRAPAALDLEVARLAAKGDALPTTSVHTVTVPGAAAGWADTLARHGRMGLADILAPAIELAERGHPVAPIVAHYWKLSEGLLRSASPHDRTLLPHGRAPHAGELFTNPNLAGVFRELADGGPRAFYEGRAADQIVEILSIYGGLMTEDDLASHTSTFEPPISTVYRDVRVWECAPNGQGLVALLALNILEGFAGAEFAPRSPELLHRQIEAMRLAFADGRRYVADPTRAPVPVEALLARDYADERRARIHMGRAQAGPEAGRPRGVSDTVYLAVVDGDGNACSFIGSNYHGFGTGIVPPGCGFTLQNRGAGFSLEPGHPNALAPRKRPYHTIIPAMTTYDDGALHACFGVMGGFMQPQGHVQVLSQLVDRGMDPQAALDEPRFCLWHDPAGTVYVEDAMPDETLAALEALGHRIQRIGGIGRTGIFGRGQVILRHPASGVLVGGSDGRADGAVAAW